MSQAMRIHHDSKHDFFNAGERQRVLTWHLLMRERSNLCSRILFNLRSRALKLLKSVDQDLQIDAVSSMRVLLHFFP